MMRLSRRFLDFNKQIVLGELGSLVGTPLAPWVLSRYTMAPDLLSLAAVIGGLVSGSVFWLVARIADGRRAGTASLRTLAGDIAFFTPAALITGLICYQPTLFFVARHLIATGHSVVLAAYAAQCVAFVRFLLAINLYRLALRRWAGKHL